MDHPRSAHIGNSIGDAHYSVEYDIDRDGDIDTTDRDLVTADNGGSILAGQVSDVGNLVGYDGYIFEPATGMYCVRHRWYLPDVGRWDSRDPVHYEAAMGLYESVHSRPLSRSDPSGLKPPPEDEWWLKPDGTIRTGWVCPPSGINYGCEFKILNEDGDVWNPAGVDPDVAPGFSGEPDPPTPFEEELEKTRQILIDLCKKHTASNDPCCDLERCLAEVDEIVAAFAAAVNEIRSGDLGGYVYCSDQAAAVEKHVMKGPNSRGKPYGCFAAGLAGKGSKGSSNHAFFIVAHRLAGEEFVALDPFKGTILPASVGAKNCKKALPTTKRIKGPYWFFSPSIVTPDEGPKRRGEDGKFHWIYPIPYLPELD